MHHGHTKSTDQHGNESHVAVLSSKDGEGRPDLKAEVALQIYGGALSASLHITPSAARDLAARLIAAADAAESPNPAPNVRELYREPEAA